MCATSFTVSAAVSVSSLVLGTWTAVAYRRMSKQAKKKLREEFVLFGKRWWAKLRNV